MKHRWPILMLLCAFVPLAGCQQFRTIAPPTVTVESVRVTEQSDEGARLEVTLALRNPNEVALPLVDAEYQVLIPGAPGLKPYVFGDDCNRTLPAKGAQTLILPAVLAAPNRDFHGTSCQVSGSISYEPPGEIRRVLTESGFPRPRVDFDRTQPLP